MAVDFPASDLPPWAIAALNQSSLSSARRDGVRWVGAAYHLLMALNRFSLTEYAAQVSQLSVIGDLALQGLHLTTRQQTIIAALLGDPKPSEADRHCSAWINEAGAVLTALNRYSLSEYGEQVRHLGQLTDLAARGLVVAKQAQGVAEALHATAAR